MTCPPFQFQCHENHICIPEHLACDGIDHCGDGSDELGCGTSMSSFSGYNGSICSVICFLCHDCAVSQSDHFVEICL